MKTLSSYITPDEYRSKLKNQTDIFLFHEVYNQLGFSINVDMTDKEREDYINELVRNYKLTLTNYKS